jgi:hypothetical protein
MASAHTSILRTSCFSESSLYPFLHSYILCVLHEQLAPQSPFQCEVRYSSLYPIPNVRYDGARGSLTFWLYGIAMTTLCLSTEAMITLLMPE